MATIDVVQKHIPTLEEAIRRCGVNDSKCLDGRDASRLAEFVPADQFSKIGVSLKDGVQPEEHIPTEWTAENVSKQLTRDVAFAFSKGLDKRGISAGCMNAVLRMWHAILQPAFEVPKYAQYGLPMCKAMAVYFELPNEIGDDDGDEYEYSQEG